MNLALEDLSLNRSWIHDLDPRPKILITFLYIILVVSGPKHGGAWLLLYGLWPLSSLLISRTPLWMILKRVLILSPFVLVLAAFNPFFEPGQTAFFLFGLEVTRTGLITSAGILIKFFLCLSALMGLVAATRFVRLLWGFSRLGLPEFFVVQISLIYRYLALLVEQVQTMLRARAARLGGKGTFRSAGSLIGTLFLRTLVRGERVHLSMGLRGFNGSFKRGDVQGMGASEGLFAAYSLIMLAGLWWFVQGKELCLS